MTKRLTAAENRAKWNEAFKAARAGKQGPTLSDIAKEQREAAAKVRAELVDDPFVPGQKVTKSLADVHPVQRLAEAVNTRFQEDNAQ